jgi:hypothetical protein
MLRRARNDMDRMDTSDERLERRLVEETSKLRVEMAGVETRLSEKIAQSEASVRGEIGALEVRMERGFGTLRADLLKWSFAFWLGQVVALSAILGAILR